MRYVKYFLVCAFFIILGIVYSREVPKLKVWLLNQIQFTGTERTNFIIKTKTLDFTLLPPGVEIKKISLTPKDDKIKKNLSEIRVDSLGVSLSTIALLTGRFEIGRVSIQHPSFNLHIKKEENTESPKEIEIPWNDIINIPIRKVIVRDAEIKAQIDEINKNISVSNFALNVEKTISAAKIEVFSPLTEINSLDNKTKLQIGLATRVIVESQAAEISALKLTLGSNLLLARGVVRGELTKLQWATANFRTLVHAGVEEIFKTLRENKLVNQLPKASGELNFEAVGSVKKNMPLVAALDLNAKNIQIEKFKIGDVRSRIKLSQNNITTDQLKVQNSAGEILLKGLSFELNEGNKFSSRVEIKNLVLEKFLVNLGLAESPLHLETFVNAACEGVLAPEHKIRCAGDAEGKNLRVYVKDKGSEKNIVALKEFKLLTHFNLEKMTMTFPEGAIQIGGSSGTANAVIKFDEGFKINFNTEGLDFKDIASLADLHYEGALGLTGSTQGDGHSATISGHVTTKGFLFEDYNLGAGQFDLRYESSALDFSNLNMGFKNTNYTGNVKLFLNDEPHLSTNINFSKLDISELKEALSRKAKLDFSLTGQGSAQVFASGPLSLSKLNYKITSQFTQGLAYDETFQNLIFNIHGEQGHVYADDVQLKKGDGQATLTGDITPQGTMSLFVKGKDLHISDFEHVRKIVSGVDGRMQLDLSLQNKILDPHISLSALISQTTINQEPLDDSTLSIDLNQDNLRFTSNIFANKIKMAFVQPRKTKTASSLKFETENWDFSPFLSAISGSDFKKDYETDLSARINLTSQTGDLLEGVGEIRIPRIFVRHGNYQMQNAAPILVKFNNGQINFESLLVRGDNTELAITGSRNKNDNLNINIKGNLELSLINFIAPFFKEMRGILNINSQVVGTTSKPEFLGNALVNRGYFKFKEFPHGFDDISADLLFSQSRIAINQLKGVFAGGDLNATGSIVVKGLRDIPLDITAQLNNATFNVPEGLNTKGSAAIKLTGNWFPFLLQADYNIDSGTFTKNFDEQDSTIQLKRSAFLPKDILLKETSPIELALNANFMKGISVKNNLIESDVKGSLEVKGDPKHVILKGEIDAVPGGKMDFRETPFTLNVAKIKFNNPTENNPNIYALGTARLRDWDITMLYQGTLDKHDIKLSSSPPLSEKSIISLLALGMTDENMEKQKTTNQILAMQASTAGSVLLSKTALIKEVRKKTGVNVRLSQTVDDTRYLARPKIIIEKQWSPKFSTGVGRTFGDRSVDDINAEYKINKNFSVLGTFEKRNYDQFSVTTTSTNTILPASQQTQVTDVLGVNLQYQVEFK